MTRSTAILALLAATTLIAPQQAFAQFKSQTEKPVVVVTPTKSKKNLDAVPFAVTVIDKNEIEKTQAQSIDDVLQNTPNYSSAGGPRTISEEPSLRGLSDRRIVIKVDGIRRNFRAQYGGRYFIDPYMIDRVEVVRGGNSSIDGSGAIAGTIQFFTPDVKNRLSTTGRNWGTEEKVGYQSGNQEFSTLLSAYGKADKADIYTALSYRAGDDVRGGNSQDIVPSDSTPRNGLVKAGFDITPGQRAEIRYSRFYDTSGLPTSPFQPADPAIGNFAAKRNSAVSDYSAKYTFTPQNALRDVINLSSVIYHSDYKINTRRNFDRRLDETDFETTGGDIYNNAKLDYFGLTHNLITGVEYFENEQSGRRNGAVRSLLGSGEDANLGLYAQQETLFGDRLSITPGIRFDHYELKPGTAANPEQTREEWSPKLGVNYRFTDAFSMYGSVAKSFRTPTLTELYATGVVFPGNTLISNPNLQPETSINKEIGARYKASGLLTAYDHLNVTAAVFQNDIDDYIEQIIGATTTQFRNVTQAKLQGFEMEGRYRVNNVAAIASVGLITGENETANQPLADVPQNRYSIGAEHYAFENTLTTGARANILEKQDKIAPGQSFITTSDGAVTYDVYASYTPQMPNNQAGQFRIDFGVDNIFDKGYRRQLSFLPEQGRNAKVTLNWKF